LLRSSWGSFPAFAVGDDGALAFQFIGEWLHLRFVPFCQRPTLFAEIGWRTWKTLAVRISLLTSLG
jgi:hypothetical protein